MAAEIIVKSERSNWGAAVGGIGAGFMVPLAINYGLSSWADAPQWVRQYQPYLCSAAGVGAAVLLAKAVEKKYGEEPAADILATGILTAAAYSLTPLVLGWINQGMRAATEAT